MKSKMFLSVLSLSILVFCASYSYGIMHWDKVARPNSVVSGDDSLGTAAETTGTFKNTGKEDAVKLAFSGTDSFTVVGQYRPIGSSGAWKVYFAIDTIPPASVDTSHAIPLGFNGCEFRFLLNDIATVGALSEVLIQKTYSTSN